MTDFRHLINKKRTSYGFTLTELLIASSIGVFIILMAGEVMLQQNQSKARLDQIQRLKEDWRRASSFLESEMALSSRLFSDRNELNHLNVHQDCDLEQRELRLAIDINRDTSVIFYGVRALKDLEENDKKNWMAFPSGEEANAGVLIRCGPTMKITADGDNDYSRTGAITQNVLLDGLDLRDGSGGLSVQSQSYAMSDNTNYLDSKTKQFLIHLRHPESSNRLSLGLATVSRINPVHEYPFDNSLCPIICDSETCKDSHVYVIHFKDSSQFSIPTDALDEADNILVCNLFTSSLVRTSITGSIGHDVLDGLPAHATQPFPGASLIGAEGNDRLFGTPGSDTLRGGNGDDILVGRQRQNVTPGDDLFDGGSGTNSYLPWQDLSGGTGGQGNVTIEGGSGQDIVFLPGNINDFKRSLICNSTSCTININPDTGTSGRLLLNKIEILVYKNSRLDLNTTGTGTH